jgi:hypothetical protein
MTKRETDLCLRITWDDELTDHPTGWEWQELVNGPFEGAQDSQVSVVSFTDEDERGDPVLV